MQMIYLEGLFEKDFVIGANGDVDADSLPKYSVFEGSNNTPIIVETDCTKRTGFTGRYHVEFTAAATVGFERGKTYHMYVKAIVGTVTYTTVFTFQVEFAPADWSGTTIDAIESMFGGGVLSTLLNAIKAKTDPLPTLPAAVTDIPSAAIVAATVLTAAAADPIKANIAKVNGHGVLGSGTPVTDPWRTAG